MRKILAVLACVLCVGTAQAQPLTAISTAITIGQWINANSKQVFYIEVESQGDTAEAARQEGFRLAIEQAVGTLILSETESQNLRLRRNDIVTYASGYVDRFEIVQRSQSGSQVRMRMKVWVAHSAIAGRLLHQQAAPREISGNTIAVQIQSFQQQQQSGDRLLDNVLQDFPVRAFDVGMEPARVALDANRQGNLQIPFVVTWSKTYLKAMEETLRNINQYPQCNTIGADCSRARSRIELDVNLVSRDPGGWFNDDVAWTVAVKNMTQDRAMYRLTLNTASGRTVRQCFDASELVDGFEYRSRYFANIGPGLIRFNGHNRERIVLTVPLSQLAVQDITQATVDIVRQSNCKQL
jgi:hypothetical protein